MRWIASLSDCSPSGSRLEFGSSRTTRKGLPNTARASADALALAAGERHAALADRGVVALGEAQDHLVHAGQPGGLDDLSVVASLRKRAMFSRDGAVEQLDALRQVADRVGERLGRILRDQRLVEADLAAGRRPGADEGAHQGDLPQPLGPMMPSASPASISKDTPATVAECQPGGTMAMSRTERRLVGPRHAVLLLDGLGQGRQRACAAA